MKPRPSFFNAIGVVRSPNPRPLSVRRIWMLVLIFMGMQTNSTHASQDEFEALRNRPGNIYDVDLPVYLTLRKVGEITPTSRLHFEVLDYHGSVVSNGLTEFQPGESGNDLANINLGILNKGYYELKASLRSGDGRSTYQDMTMSFAVAEQQPITENEFANSPHRFGLKLWTMGPMSWRKNEDWNEAEIVEASLNSKLPWTRAPFNLDEEIPVNDVIEKYSGNVILKIERFPQQCFDEGRYSNFDNYYKNDGGRSWHKNTLPRKSCYQLWLKDRLRELGVNKNIYEVWNEPWQWQNTMSAVDFANLSNWVAKTTKDIYPDALVGPNLKGRTHLYDIETILAGALDNADLVTIHPYTSGTPEDKNFRAMLRNYNDLLKVLTGKNLPLYATEFGWSSAPDKHPLVSENEQARRVVREALMLYAEGVKVIIPHTMGQREQNPKDSEHYFGFFRANHQPKPVFSAFVNCAKLIDGSQFVGDLDLGQDVGAMVFFKDDNYTLALWTKGDTKTLAINTFTDQPIKYTDIVGRHSLRQPSDGVLNIDIDGNVVYLTGLGQDILSLVIPPNQRLVERWNQRGGSIAVGNRTSLLTVDGQIEDWDANAFKEARRSDEFELNWDIKWDDDFLYLAAVVTDSSIISEFDGSSKKVDALLLSLSSRPERQGKETDLYDFTFRFVPSNDPERARLEISNSLLNVSDIRPGVQQGNSDISGLSWKMTKSDTSWTIEAAIPLELIQMHRPPANERLAFNLVVFDRDTQAFDEWHTWNTRVQVHNMKSAPSTQPYLVLDQSL